MTTSKWDSIRALPRATLAELFANEPNRLAKLSVDVAGIHFDFSKTHLTADAIAAFERIAKASDLAGKREALFKGEKVNVTEGRAVGHTAERGEGEPEMVARAAQLHVRMRALIDAIGAGALGPIRHILHVGIGGSALGPDLLVDALGRDSETYDVAIVSNVDGVALEDALDRFEPDATLLVVASKTFTTTETMLNAGSVIQWMQEGGVDDPYGRVIALTASPDQAVEWGVDETRVLPFDESVGGRYSLWSSIGFPAAIKLGWDAFEELLDGAAEMDRHFRLAATHENAALLAAFADLYYTHNRGAETRATFAYDQRLALLPSYLQQLEMESNGKGVTTDGQPLDGPSAAITWGGVGTDAQHAVFQLLHQGTHQVPVEFVTCVEPGDTLSPDHHRQLLLNAFAQGAALMKGKANPDDPASAYPGDRPSTTILLDRLDARTLGALIAFYEHRVFTNGALLGINSFDQFGVELGKEMAKAAEKGGGDFDPSTTDLIARRAQLMAKPTTKKPAAKQPATKAKASPAAKAKAKPAAKPEYDYDLFVIGAGSGGTRASRVAAAHGAKVAVAEEYRVGGTCVIRGCVPKKLLIYGAHFAEDLHDAKRFGWDVGDCNFDWPTLRDNVLADVDRLNGAYTNTLESQGVDIILERAEFVDPHTLKLSGGRTVTARTILIATGATPAVPACPGHELGITSNEAFHLDSVPKRMLIAGAGYIANEFAGIFHQLGAHVTLINRTDVILRGYDEQVRDRLLQISLTKGIDFRFHAEFASIEKVKGGLKVSMGGDHEPIEVDCVMFATGRVPNTDGLGLDKAGVKIDDKGAVIVDERNQSNVKHIYAVGDVTNRVQLTPVAIREGQAFADTVFGGKPTVIDYDCIPAACFSHPPIAGVGMTESQAKQKFGSVRVYTSDFRPMKNVLAGRNERALYKLICDSETDRILGLHMIGPDAPEILQAAAIAVKAGLKKSDFDATVALHPTMAEELVLMR